MILGVIVVLPFYSPVPRVLYHKLDVSARCPLPCLHYRVAVCVNGRFCRSNCSLLCRSSWVFAGTGSLGERQKFKRRTKSVDVEEMQRRGSFTEAWCLGTGHCLARYRGPQGRQPRRYFKTAGRSLPLFVRCPKCRVRVSCVEARAYRVMRIFKTNLISGSTLD